MTQLSGGRAQFNLIGFPGLVYRIHASTNWIDWSPLVSITSANGLLQFTDPVSTNQTQRFYRAVTQ